MAAEALLELVDEGGVARTRLGRVRGVAGALPGRQQDKGRDQHEQETGDADRGMHLHPGEQDHDANHETEPGQRGAPSGDLYVVVHVKAHKIFERHNLDLHCELPISIVTAALGGEVEVPTLDGKVKLNIPKETQTGRRMRIKGKGLKSLRSSAVGDIYCHILVETPTNLTDRQKELLEEFGRLSSGSDTDNSSGKPRDKSFTDKLRDLFD